MADVSVKMGVSGVSEFKAGMKSAEEAVKTLDATLKLNEEQFKATGDAEVYMSNKTALLKRQIQEQKSIIAQGEAALKAMKNSGVDPTSRSFQTMQRNVLKAQGELLKMDTELKNVSTDAGAAKSSTDGMNQEMKNIGKGVAWENVTNGISKITDGLEKGFQAAKRFVSKIKESATDSTEWADDVLTRAMEYGVDAEMIQRMDNVAHYIDVDTETIVKAKQKLAKNQDKISEWLGIDTDGKSIDETFWEVGEAIKSMSDEWDKETAAQEIFGKGWKELLPLFIAGQEEYQRLMDEQNVLTNEQVESLGKADDAFKSVELEIQKMKNEFWAEHAPKIVEMMEWLVKNKGPVVAALGVIGAAFGALKLAEAAANIGKIIEGFKQLGVISGGGNASVQAPTTTAAPGAETAASGAVSGFFQTLLNNMISGMGVATTLQMMEEIRAKFAEQTEGLSVQDAQKKILMEQWGLDEEAYQEFLTAIGQEEPEIEVEPVAPEDAAESIAEQVGTVTIPVLLVPQNDLPGSFPGGAGGSTPKSYARGLTEDYVPHANGIPFIPFDGYRAILHKGERVVPAREAGSSRSFSSNLYVESMYMNNGQDADGLAAAMAAAQRRTMSGFGS